MIKTQVLSGGSQLLLHMLPVVNMTDDQFFEFCQLNRELRIERTADGDLIIAPPVGGQMSHKNAELTTALLIWAKQDGTGLVFDSSGGFILPNGATRSADAAWVKRSKWAALTDEQKTQFSPISPDFVIELRSRSDNLRPLQKKMQEYMDNGVQLGWLIDPKYKRVYVYRPKRNVERLNSPTHVSGDPELPGFVLDLQDIW